MYDLSRFTLPDMTRLGVELRKCGAGARTMEEAAERVVRTLYEQLKGPENGERACVLARTFVTVPYADLQPPQQDFARRLLPGIKEQPGIKCLTLLATAGDEQAWNSRRTSTGHSALPLPSVESIARSPMIAQLMTQLGVRVDALLSPDQGGAANLVVDSGQHSFNVFHVPEARGSAHIPAQREFVEPYGVQSVIGFGGILPMGGLYATILFSRVPVTRESALLFKTLALNVKVALLPFGPGQLFS